MKIALLIDSIVRGGAERQALYTFRELRRRGIDISIIYYHEAPNQFDLLDSEKSGIFFLSKSNRPLKFLWRLRKLLSQQRFEIVHAFKDTPCFYGALATRMAGTPVFVAGHRTQGLPVGKFRCAFNLVNRMCTAWVCNSRAAGKSIQCTLGTPSSKIFTIYNGIDPEEFRSSLSAPQAKQRIGLSPDQPVVTIIAVLRPEKNHSMFIRVAARVALARPDTAFLVVGCARAGDTTTLENLKQLARSLGIEKLVRFLGMRTDIPDVLRATDVVVLTSEVEGMSNALLEAMSAGVSFVTTRYTGVDELMEDSVQGYSTPLNDDEAMAARIVELLNNTKLRHQLGSAGMETVEKKFSIQVMGDNLLKIYQQLLGIAAPISVSHSQAR